MVRSDERALPQIIDLIIVVFIEDNLNSDPAVIDYIEFVCTKLFVLNYFNLLHLEGVRVESEELCVGIPLLWLHVESDLD